MRTHAWVAAALLALAQAAPAQSVGRMLADDWKNAGKDILGVWASPFHASRTDWLLTGAAIAATGASMLVDRPVSDWAIRNKNSAGFRALGPVRRGGWMFSGKYVVPPVAVAYIVGVATQNQDLRDFVTGCGASWAANSVLRKALYSVVGRARPDSLPDDPQHWTGPGGSGSWMMHSFPAGHFANAMSCASFVNHRFHLGVGEPALYALAGAVGIGRLADEAHWTSDSVIGGVLGYAIGKEVAHRSLQRLHPAAQQTSLYIAPGLSGVTIGVGWSF